jgi:hypothetical protein
MTGLSVNDIAQITGGGIHGGEGRTPVTSVVIDSRAVTPGAMFAALPGERVDGCFLREARRYCSSDSSICDFLRKGNTPVVICVIITGLLLRFMIQPVISFMNIPDIKYLLTTWCFSDIENQAEEGNYESIGL